MNSNVLGLLIASLLLAMPAQAKLFKWVDDNGQVHYGDKIPEKYLVKENEELNEQGTVVKKHERAPTQEELAEKKRQEAELKRKEEEARAQALRDRVLTDTYTTERDLIAARDARLTAVDSQIRLSEDIIKGSTEAVAKTEKIIERLKKQGKQVPQATTEKLEKEKMQLATQRGVQEGHRMKRAEIEQQFDGYIKRFRELMAEKEEKRKLVEQHRRERDRKAMGLDP